MIFKDFFSLQNLIQGVFFTERKTYNSSIFHIYINVGENLFLGVLIDFYKKKRKSSNIFTSIQVWIYDKSYVFLMVKSPPESDSAMKKKWTSTTPSFSGPLPTHRIQRHLVPGAVYSSSLHLCFLKNVISMSVHNRPRYSKSNQIIVSRYTLPHW